MRLSISLATAMTGAFLFSGFRQLTAYSTAFLEHCKLNESYAEILSSVYKGIGILVLFITSLTSDKIAMRPHLFISCLGTAACWLVMAFVDFIPEAGETMFA